MLGLDLRGFGRSAGTYNVRKFELFLQDIRAALVVADARAKELGARVVYFGHSLGGLLGALFNAIPGINQTYSCAVARRPKQNPWNTYCTPDCSSTRRVAHPACAVGGMLCHRCSDVRAKLGQ